MWSAQKSFVAFRKFDVFHTFSVLFVLSDMIENAWKNSGFLKSNKGLLCTPDLRGEVSLSSLVTIFKGKVTNIFNKQEIKDFVLSYKLFIFSPSFPNYPACPRNRKWICCSTSLIKNSVTTFLGLYSFFCVVNSIFQ